MLLIVNLLLTSNKYNRMLRFPAKRNMFHTDCGIGITSQPNVVEKDIIL